MWRRLRNTHVLLRVRAFGDSPVSLAMTHMRWSSGQSGHESTDYTRNVVHCVDGLRAYPIDRCSDKDASENEQDAHTEERTKAAWRHVLEPEADLEEILAEADAVQERGELFDPAPPARGCKRCWRDLRRKIEFLDAEEQDEEPAHVEPACDEEPADEKVPTLVKVDEASTGEGRPARPALPPPTSGPTATVSKITNFFALPLMYGTATEKDLRASVASSSKVGA